MSATETEHKILTEPRLIAGYLRDAVFQNRSFFLKSDYYAFNANLHAITESSARDKSSDRFLAFTIVSDIDSVTLSQVGIGSDLYIAVALDRLMLKFNSKISSVLGKTITVTMPTEAKAIIARKNYRFQAHYLAPQSCAVIIKNLDNSKFFGKFAISDISSTGFGGTLILGQNQKVDRRACISGKLLQQAGSIIIDGRISWIKEVSSELEQRFRIGIENLPQAKEHDSADSVERDRRSKPRLRAEFLIEVISPLFPKSPSSLQVEDISLQGLRARFINIADATLFRPGLEVLMTSPKLRLRVIQMSSFSVTFCVLRSALEEHIKLFNLHSFMSERDLALKTPVASDLSQVYTTSGSFSTELARVLSANSSHLLSANAAKSSDSLWYLRWLQQSDEGRIKAVILTSPYSDHVWYLGGLAGHLDEELKMDRDFVARYFKALHNFLDSLDSNEYLFFNWFKSNTHWDDWEAFLGKQQQRDDFFRFDGDIVYIRGQSQLNPLSNEQAEWSLIPQGSISKVESILNNIERQDLRRLFIALGLNPFTFGAPTVAELLVRSGHYFFRKFYELQMGDCFIVAMISAFPDYTFLNGIVNYPLVYASRQLTIQELDYVANKLLEMCAMSGVEMPAFFLTSAGKSQVQRQSTNLQIREIVWTFGTQEALSYWLNK